MDKTKVLENLKNITGEDEDSRYDSFVSAAISKLNLMIRNDIDETPYIELLEMTATLLAFLQLTVTENISSPIEIKAGEVSIKNSTDLGELKNRIDENFEILAPILKDSQFIFEVTVYEKDN